MSTHGSDPLAALEQQVAALQQLADRSEREVRTRDSERAQAARDGELGKDWQEVQRRIDAGETSLTAVFSGADESPAARRLLGTAQQRLDELSEQLPPELEAEVAEVEAETAGLGRGALGRRPGPESDDGGQPS